MRINELIGELLYIKYLEQCLMVVKHRVHDIVVITSVLGHVCLSQTGHEECWLWLPWIIRCIPKCPKVKKHQDNSVSKNVENLELSYELVGMWNGTVTLGNHLAVPQKVKHGVMTCMWSGSSTLGIYPRELKTYVRTKTCARLSMAALFIIAKNVETNVRQLKNG